MKRLFKLLPVLISLSCLGALQPQASAATLSATKLPAGDWASIRSAYEARRHHITQQANGTLTGRNPGLGWQLTFDDKGFTATDGHWTWGLELTVAITAPRDEPRALHDEASPSLPALSSSRGAMTATFQRTPQLTEWFVNDTRGLEQGWTLQSKIPNLNSKISLRVRGNLKATISPQSITFGNQLTYSGLKAWDANHKTIPTHFEPTNDGFAVVFDDTGAQYPITIDPMAQNAYLKASNPGFSDLFGGAVSVSGDTVVISARSEDSSSTGVNGDQTDDSASSAGAVYVFVRSGGGWTQQAYLKASNPAVNDGFGWSLGISGDTIVIGAPAEASNATGVNGNQTNNTAPGAGAAYVFVRTGTTWTQRAYLKASNAELDDNFGWSVAVSGTTVVVGAPNERSNAIGVNGDQSNNSQPYAGAAYVFTPSGSTWKQQAYLKMPYTRGYNSGSAVSASGNTIVIGAPWDDSNASGVNGDPVNEIGNNTGAAVVFVRTGTVWSQQAYLKASNPGDFDEFGGAVAVSGDRIIVGARLEDSNATGVNGNQASNTAPDSGAAYVFVRTGSTWVQDAYVKASNTETLDEFGWAVSVSGDTAIVGTYLESSNAIGINGNQLSNSAAASGAAYLFTRTGGLWGQLAYLKASNTDAGDSFGTSVATSGDIVIIGADFEAGNASGVNGNQADNSLSDSGAAYIFNLGEILTTLSKTSTAAPGGPDINFGASGFTAINPTGQALFESALTGPGAPTGKNKGMMSTVAGPVDLALQTGSLMSGILGLPTAAKVVTVTNGVHNSTTALFQATVSGTGITSANNRVLLTDNGVYVATLGRIGLPIASLNNAVPTSYAQVIQQDPGTDLLCTLYTLKTGSGTPATNASSDSGLLFMNLSGLVINFGTREGSPAFSGGIFGQFIRSAHTSGGYTSFIAKWISFPGVAPRDAMFYAAGGSARNTPLQGAPADGTTNGELYGTFTGVTRVSNVGLLRATMTNCPLATNEGVWNESGQLKLRKGDTIAPNLKVSKIIRVWGTNANQIIFQVALSGTGVTAANNQALILRKITNTFQILARTGDPAPGIGLSAVKLGSFQAIDVDPVAGHYVILSGLTGAASNANQVLLSGSIALGNDSSLQHLRLPQLRLRKADRYQTTASPSATIKSISIKPAVDATGVGGRGLARTINDDGQILVAITGLNGAQELVKLTP